MPKAEVIGEGNPFKIRVTLLEGDEESHEIISSAAIARLPEGVWVLENYAPQNSGPRIVAECHYRQLSAEVHGPGPIEVLAIGDQDVKIIRVKKKR